MPSWGLKHLNVHQRRRAVDCNALLAVKCQAQQLVQQGRLCNVTHAWYLEWLLVTVHISASSSMQEPLSNRHTTEMLLISSHSVMVQSVQVQLADTTNQEKMQRNSTWLGAEQVIDLERVRDFATLKQQQSPRNLCTAKS